jgi:hypothetical protein
MQHCIRNNNFFGREEELSQLHGDLEVGSVNYRSPRLPSVVIYSLGGFEKSSIALEYLYRHYDAYPVILWLYADKKDKLDSQFVQLARLLRLPIEAGNINNGREAVLH